jgi:hypothetical protein
MHSRNAGSGSPKPPEPANRPKMDLIAKKTVLSLSGICKSRDEESVEIKEITEDNWMLECKKDALGCKFSKHEEKKEDEEDDENNEKEKNKLN